MGFIKRCAYCSKHIMVRESLLGRKKYCSKDCMDKHRRGKSCSPDTEFKKGNRPQTWVPVGSEVKTKGYIRVKVAEPNIWRQRSHIIWEEANNESLPGGWIVRHIDGDPLNDSPENLKPMPRSQHFIETLKDPVIEKRTREAVSKAGKRRWKEYREKQYDSYYWQ